MTIRRCQWFVLAFAVAMFPVLLGPAVARDEPRRAGASDKGSREKAEKNALIIQQLTLAHDLAEQGRKAKSPLALLSAADIYRKISDNPTPVKDEPKVEVEKGIEEKKPEEVEKPLTPAEESDLLLADAKKMIKNLLKAKDITAEEAQALRTLADAIGAKGSRGAVGGPQERSGFLHPGHTHLYNIKFNGLTNEYARVFGNGRTMLRLTVHNPGGVLRGIDTGMNPGGNWVSERGGNVFTIRITNLGSTGTGYRLVTN